jgi:hypothetical protein
MSIRISKDSSVGTVLVAGNVKGGLKIGGGNIVSGAARKPGVGTVVMAGDIDGDVKIEGGKITVGGVAVGPAPKAADKKAVSSAAAAKKPSSGAGGKAVGSDSDVSDSDEA